MDNEKNNVVTFPKEKLRTPSNIQSQEDLLQQIQDYKMSFADDIAEILSNHIFGELGRSGINFEADIDALFPSMVLVTEAIQSLQLRGAGVHHPLQDFAEDVYGEGSEEQPPTDDETIDITEQSPDDLTSEKNGDNEN